ncbi:hypothetical protein KBB68_02525 [Candidatus Babeliales bacterium]|nr:hypothetical protein [Candidatus Babeliales bacterium]
MKKLLFFIAILSTQASYSSNNNQPRFLGVIPSMYVSNSESTVQLLIYIAKKNTGKVDITVTPFDERRFNLAKQLKQLLSQKNIELYLNKITEEITKYGTALPK